MRSVSVSGVRRSGEKGANYRQRTTERELPTANYRVGLCAVFQFLECGDQERKERTTDSELPSENYRQQTTERELPTANYRARTTERELLTMATERLAVLASAGESSVVTTFRTNSHFVS